MIKYINYEILKLSKDLTYIVKDNAPSTELELFNETNLVIWSGASNNTIYQDETVNWAFRAIHDATHLKTGLGFSPQHEIEMGKIQAALLSSQCKSLLADLFYCEIAEQAKYFSQNGTFVDDQVTFTKQFLKIK